VRVRTEALVAADGSEVDHAVVELGFDYGGVRVRAADRRPRFFTSAGGAPVEVERDAAAERRARYLLESLGAVELACLDEPTAAPGSQADYLVRADGDVHALCSFTAYALPQLRALGWRVDVASDYRYQVVEGDRPWYAQLDRGRGDDDDRPDWFNLELGIDVDGTRVNLLPGLLELLERLPHAGRLESLLPARGFAVPVMRASGGGLRPPQLIAGGAGDPPRVPSTDDGARYLVIPRERMRVLVDVLRELYDPEFRALSFSAARAASLAALDQACGGQLRWEGATAVRERGQALAAAPTAVAVPAGLRAVLRPYQQAGLAWLQHLHAHDAGGILADDMGLGKTLQVIAHLVTEKEAGRLDQPALVVVPTSLVGNWRRELGRFAPSLQVVVLHGPRRHAERIGRADVVLTTYALLVRDGERLAARSFSLLVLDEAQAIKNARSQAHRAALAIPARRRLCMTGTPIENTLGELWALFELLMPGLLGDADWFRHRYQHPIEREGNGERLAALRAQVAPFILRRTKEEVARELPPKTEIVRPVELHGPQRDLYESLRVAAHAEVRQAIRRKGLAASAIAILDALMKLRQVCCDPRLLPGETAQSVHASAKLDLFLELLGQQLERGRRVLVFSQFASMLRLLGEALRARGVRHTTLTGATVDRQRVVDTFESGRADVFLISLKAGGTGLNLISADTVIHYDPWWNPAAQAQATDRAHRIGQTRPVFVYQLIVAGSVEERMLSLQRRKRQLADGVLAADGPSALPLTVEDVDRLFAPIADG
jgi:superfamily II DNA or RNA helicase